MRVRADQVRVGHRLGGAVVTKVRPTLDWGVVRITVENAERPAGLTAMGVPVPSGTFSYLPDDIVDVQREANDPATVPVSRPAGTSTASRTVVGPEERVNPTPLRPSSRRPGVGGALYRVEYLATTGDGHIVVRADDSTTTSLVGQALDLLEAEGIDARIRRIVPLDRPSRQR